MFACSVQSFLFCRVTLLIKNRLLARNNAKEAAQVTFDGALQLLQASNATAATELATLHVHCLENEPPTREQTGK